MLEHVLGGEVARPEPVRREAHHRDHAVLAEDPPQTVDVIHGERRGQSSYKQRYNFQMYVEERIYTLHVGKVAEYFKNYETDGLAVQLKHLPHLVGYYFNEIGPQNTVVH